MATCDKRGSQLLVGYMQLEGLACCRALTHRKACLGQCSQKTSVINELRSDARRTMLRTGDERGVAGAAHSGEVRQRATHFAFGIVLLRHQHKRVGHVALPKPLAKMQLLLRRQSQHPASTDQVRRSRRSPWPPPQPRHAQHVAHAVEPAAFAQGTHPAWRRESVRHGHGCSRCAADTPAGFVQHPHETFMSKYRIALACVWAHIRKSTPHVLVNRHQLTHPTLCDNARQQSALTAANAHQQHSQPRRS